MKFPFHCMQTGIGREATQGNTSRCWVPLDVGDAAMVVALRPQSPCGKAQDGCRTMPCRFAGHASIAKRGEPAPEALRPRTRVWASGCPGHRRNAKKRWHQPPGERNELPETAFSSCKRTCSSGKVRKANRDQHHEPRPHGFHGPASLRSRRRRPALCGLVGFRGCCRSLSELPNPSLSVFFAVRTGNDPFGRRVAFGLTDL